MLGVVFTEFVEMVEARFSPAVLDAVIDGAQVGHGGGYTAVGDYPHAEMVRLLESLSARTGVPVSELLESFGRYLFNRLASMHPSLIAERPSLFDLLGRLDDTIHPEVLRLYPQAQLPHFEVIERDGRHLVLRYDSPRRMEGLAKGLIFGAAAAYGVDVNVQLQPVHDHDPHVRIHVTSAS
jgi:hypothetical protein